MTEEEKQRMSEAAKARLAARTDSRGDSDGWIPLERVEFRSAVSVPGRARGIYPAKETVVGDNPQRGERSCKLWLSLDDGEVVMQHPSSGCRERVPLSNVAQYRRAGDHPGDAAVVRPTGMVRSLPT